LLVIRLARTGRTKYPTYRIVAAESARAATSRFVENLGNYNPHTKELVIKREEIAVRLSQGAQPSNTVIKLLLRAGVELPAWAKLKTKAPKPVEAIAEEVVEAPVTEEVTEAEAAADADGVEVASEVRVAAVAEEAAIVAEDAEPNIDTTETADADAKAVAEVKAGDDAAADAAEKAKA
jgi:small subunit ribosomal protein S16